MAVWHLWGGRRLGAFLAALVVCGLLPKWRAMLMWFLLECERRGVGGGEGVCSDEVSADLRLPGRAA